MNKLKQKQTTQSIIKAVKNIAEYFGPCFETDCHNSQNFPHYISLQNIESREGEKNTYRTRKKKKKKVCEKKKKKDPLWRESLYLVWECFKGNRKYLCLKINYRSEPSKNLKR